MDELRLPTPPPILHAPKYRLDAAGDGNRLHLATVEYPGPVNSVPSALDSLGGLHSVAQAFAAVAPRAGDAAAAPHDAAPAAERVPLEFNLDPGNRFSHPVQAHIAPTSNIVCRVVKRRRKKPVRDAAGDVVDAGMYQIQPIAVEHRLARFRGQFARLPATVTACDLTEDRPPHSYGRLSVHPAAARRTRSHARHGPSDRKPRQ